MRTKELDTRPAEAMTMYDPPHPGELVRDCIIDSNWTVTVAAQRIGVTRAALSRVLNGRAAVSPAMALAFERLGWSDADHWVRMQGAFDLARERSKQNEAA